MKKTDKFQWFPKYKKSLIIISSISLMISVVLWFINSLGIYLIIRLTILSVLFYWIYFGISYLIFAFQLFVFFRPIKLSKFFAYFYMYSLLFAFVVLLIIPFIWFYKNETIVLALNYSFGCLGMMKGIYKIYLKFIY